MRNLFSRLCNYVITSVSLFTAIRYWILDLSAIDLITSILLMLIAIAGFGKVYAGWKFPVINNFPKLKRFFDKFNNILKTKPEKYLRIVENSEEFSTFFFKTIVKGGKIMRKKIITALVFIFKANPKTSTANITAVGAYVALVTNLLYKYNINNFEIFFKQSTEFYLWLGIYTVGLILLLIGVNGLGLESIQHWLNRINKKSLDKIIKTLVEIDFISNVDFVDKTIEEGYRLLKAIQDYIREEEYIKIKNKLDEIKDRLEQYYAKKELENEIRRQERLRRAKEIEQRLSKNEKSQNDNIFRLD